MPAPPARGARHRAAPVHPSDRADRRGRERCGQWGSGGWRLCASGTGRGGKVSITLCYSQISTMKERILKRFNDEIAALERELKVDLPKEIQRARELGDL